MKEANETNPTPISNASRMEEISDFWDSHSLSDYWDRTEITSFEVRAKQKKRNAISSEICSEVEAQANSCGISPEALINLWLNERLEQERLD